MTAKRSTTMVLSNDDFKPSPVKRPTPKEAGNEYAELKHLIKQRGLLEKQPAYYTYRVALLLGLLLIGIVFFLLVNVLWLQLLDAVYMAFVFAQVGLVSHEAGHRQMFARSWKHDLLGLVGGNLLIGMSYSWWLDKHNKHHSHPNQVDMDPDIEIPFLEFTGMEDVQKMGKFRRFLVKHQALLFFPALMTVAGGLQYNSIAFLLHQKARYKGLEWLLLVAHYVLYFAFVFSHVPFWAGILFIAIHQAATGFYLGSIFAPNHKGMPVLEKESKVSFLQRQIMTSRNIHAHPLTDFVYGGLNYQIEHHLFPAMPRNKLKEAQGIVKAFCQERSIPYHETNVTQSFKEILQHLHLIGAPLRRA